MPSLLFGITPKPPQHLKLEVSAAPADQRSRPPSIHRISDRVIRGIPSRLDLNWNPHALQSCSVVSRASKIPPGARSRRSSLLIPTSRGRNMSGFFSGEAGHNQQTLMGQGEDAQLWFDEHQMLQEGTTPYVDEDSNWAHAHTSDSGFEYFHPLPQFSDAAYPTLTSSPGFLPYNNMGYPGTETNVSYAPSASSMSSAGSLYAATSLSVPSTGSSVAGPSSHPQAQSRSPSPHPSDLYNYGTLNADNRTWKCAYPGCHSKAIFVRPCDLRKHFHRHNKQFFCRHEGCSQSREGGFSSKKDRLRHESKHNPGVECEWEGCERIFSRVDNMRNHMQRSGCIPIHAGVHNDLDAHVFHRATLSIKLTSS